MNYLMILVLIAVLFSTNDYFANAVPTETQSHSDSHSNSHSKSHSNSHSHSPLHTHSQSKQGCAQPSSTSSLNYTVSTCATLTQNGATCTPKCKTGYVPSGSLVQTCVNGVFSPSTVTCANSASRSHSHSYTKKLCGQPKATKSVNYTTCALYYVNGGKCTPKCSSGYASNGSLTVTCQSGKWSAPVGACNPKSCVRPNNTITPYAITDFTVCNLTTPNGKNCTPACECVKPGRHIPHKASNFNITCSAGKFSKALNNCTKSCLMNLHPDYPALKQGVGLTIFFLLSIDIAILYYVHLYSKKNNVGPSL